MGTIADDFTGSMPLTDTFALCSIDGSAAAALPCRPKDRQHPRPRDPHSPSGTFRPTLVAPQALSHHPPSTACLTHPLAVAPAAAAVLLRISFTHREDADASVGIRPDGPASGGRDGNAVRSVVPECRPSPS